MPDNAELLKKASVAIKGLNSEVTALKIQATDYATKVAELDAMKVEKARFERIVNLVEKQASYGQVPPDEKLSRVLELSKVADLDLDSLEKAVAIVAEGGDGLLGKISKTASDNSQDTPHAAFWKRMEGELK